MIVHVLTLFPQMFDGFLNESLVAIARSKGLLDVRLLDYRQFSKDRHHTVDDRPFGGGPGMVLKPEPIFDAVESVEARRRERNPEADPLLKLVLTPQGERFDQAMAQDLSQRDEFLMLSGRYEGFDERIHEGFDWREVSLGDFVLCGGEVAAMAIIEASMRLKPGVLGHPESVVHESFQEGLLDFPQYTRPREFRGSVVPEILLSGDHERIAEWRRRQSVERTRLRRKDLLTESSRLDEPSETDRD